MASKLMVFAKFVGIRQRNNYPNFVEVFVRSSLFLQKNMGKYGTGTEICETRQGGKIRENFILHLMPPHYKHYEYFSLQLG
jgi:hypothetical protein